MKKNKIFKYIYSLLFIVGTFSLIGANNSLAVTITPYTLVGTNPDNSTINLKSPPAYKISGSPYFSNGTILYKQYFRDITYYSPKPPPSSQEAKTISAKYTNWGFWDFKLNKETKDRVFKSNFFYYTASLNYDCKPKIAKSNGLPKTSSITLKKDKVLEVLTITQEGSGTIYVYFNGAKAGVTDAVNGVARVPIDAVKLNGTRYKMYFDEYYDTTTKYIDDNGNSHLCNTFYHNFKPYRLKDEGYLGVGHNRTTSSGVYVVPSNVNTCSLKEKEGEWRYLGLSSNGNPIANPYFPSDWVSFMGNANMKYYDWSPNPWTDSSYFKTLYSSTKTTFDIENVTDKEKALEKIMGSYAPYEIGWTSKKLSTSDFASRLTLLTHPSDETAVFAGARNTGGVTREFIIKNSSVIRDLYVARVTIKNENNDIIAQGSRSSATASFVKNTAYTGVLNKGNYYTVEVILGNGSNNWLKSSTLKANAGTSVGKSLNQNTFISDTTQLSPNVSLSDRGGLSASKGSLSNPFIYGFKVERNHSYDYLDVYGFVSADHTGIDNLNFTNDTGGLRVSVYSPEEKGDLKVNSIELLDSNNTVVYKVDSSNNVSIRKAIIPGESYKIRFGATYSGSTLYIKEWKNGKWTYNTDWVSNPNVVERYIIPIKYSLVRKVGNTLSSDSKTTTVNFTTSTGLTPVPMVNGINLYYTTGSYVFEHPYLEASFNIATTNTVINKSSSNDSLSTTLKDTFDVSLSNIRVTPSIEYIESGNKTVNYNVTYNATLTVPSYVNTDYQTTMQTSISINGQKYTVYDHLNIGANNNLTHPISNVNVSAGTIYTEVVLNSDLALYETSNYSNNKSKVSSSIESIKNPFLGKPSDKAGSTYNGSTTSITKGGSANNNCLIPRTSNTYTSVYNIHKWSSTSSTYPNFNGTGNITYKKYYTVSKSQSALTTNTENFIIKDILFKSKYTTDNKLGSNGWVSMINSNNSIIKSGYGFELKVIVEYKTNALLNNPTWSANTTSGTTVSNLASDINITPDIYVELPGSTSTRKILSATGYFGTKKGLLVTQSKNKVVTGSGTSKMQVSQWEYTIKPSKTVGIKETEKIFIPENLKNGSYKISIYTPPVTGVSSLDETAQLKYGALCDRKDVYVKVSGSATDDLHSHITQ